MTEPADLSIGQHVQVLDPDQPDAGYVDARVHKINEITGWAIVDITNCRRTHVKVTAIKIETEA
jgi:hypothetical protein